MTDKPYRIDTWTQSDPGNPLPSGSVRVTHIESDIAVTARFGSKERIKTMHKAVLYARAKVDEKLQAP